MPRDKIVIVSGGFGDPRLLHNGWLRLATLSATLIGLAAQRSLYEGRPVAMSEPFA